MAIVCMINVVQCYYAAKPLFDEVWDTDLALVALGDAIQSFLEVPDKFTEGQCLLSHKIVDSATVSKRRRIEYRTLHQRQKRSPAVVEPTVWTQSPAFRWFEAIGRRDYRFTISLCVYQVHYVYIRLKLV